MPDPTNVAIEENDSLDPVVKAGIIEHHEHKKAEQKAEEEAAKAEKDQQLKDEYEDRTGHEPIDPLSL